MVKMIEEVLIRWRCPNCSYITFIKPQKGQCPSCQEGVSYEYLTGQED
jgi:rubrerythrin